MELNKPVELGFLQAIEADSCLFILRPPDKPDKFIVLVCYVDDIFGTSNDESLITWFNTQMKTT